jgi:hypothetical protein
MPDKLLLRAIRMIALDTSLGPMPGLPNQRASDESPHPGYPLDSAEQIRVLSRERLQAQGRSGALPSIARCKNSNPRHKHPRGKAAQLPPDFHRAQIPPPSYSQVRNAKLVEERKREEAEFARREAAFRVRQTLRDARKKELSRRSNLNREALRSPGEWLQLPRFPLGSGPERVARSRAPRAPPKQQNLAAEQEALKLRQQQPTGPHVRGAAAARQGRGRSVSHLGFFASGATQRHSTRGGADGRGTGEMLGWEAPGGDLRKPGPRSPRAGGLPRLDDTARDASPIRVATPRGRSPRGRAGADGNMARSFNRFLKEKKAKTSGAAPPAARRGAIHGLDGGAARREAPGPTASSPWRGAQGAGGSPMVLPQAPGAPGDCMALPRSWRPHLSYGPPALLAPASLLWP